MIRVWSNGTIRPSRFLIELGLAEEEKSNPTGETDFGKIDEAIEKFNKAIELNPGYGEAQKNLEIAFKAKKTG